MPLRRLLLVSLALSGITHAEALTLLTHGKVAVFRERGPGRQTALIRVVKAPPLARPIDPTCPTTSSLQIAAYPTATNRLEAQPVVELPCANWRAARGGFLYDDRTGGAGGVRKIVYTAGKLVIRIEGGTYTHVAGPLGYAEAWLGIGDERFLVRVHNFARNEAGVVSTRRPSFAAAEGEAAFWDVLWGDDASEARQTVALHCLEKAAKRSRKDGRARFLLAMMRLYRFDQATAEYRTASPVARDEIRKAHDAFQAAVPLVWTGSAGDSRVPGFAAAAKYVLGVVDGDPAMTTEGLADLEAAVGINPLFNLFDYIGAVPGTILPDDPLYARVIEILDFALAPENASCVGTQPEICGNRGMAPHNIEGAFLLFGDLYAKGGVLNDPGRPFGGAETIYGLTRAFGALYQWNPAFRAIADDRVATAASRVALYRNADPDDDPPLVGSAPGEVTCAFCHLKR
jgi:hypothetical protein